MLAKVDRQLATRERHSARKLTSKLYFFPIDNFSQIIPNCERQIFRFIRKEKKKKKICPTFGKDLKELYLYEPVLFEGTNTQYPGSSPAAPRKMGLCGIPFPCSSPVAMQHSHLLSSLSPSFYSCSCLFPHLHTWQTTQVETAGEAAAVQNEWHSEDKIQ